MEEALNAGRSSIGVLPAKLARTVANDEGYLESGQLTLAGPFSLDGHWAGWKAMSRRYIYCLADAAVAIGSKYGTGGTWAGAKETLNNKWVPLWVKESGDRSSGNRALAERGAKILGDGIRLTALTAGRALANDPCRLFAQPTPTPAPHCSPCTAAAIGSHYRYPHYPFQSRMQCGRREQASRTLQAFGKTDHCYLPRRLASRRSRTRDSSYRRVRKRHT